MNRYRVNCLEKMLELNIENKYLLDLAIKNWHILTIQNRHLDEIGLAFGSSQEKTKSKIRFLATTKLYKDALIQFKEEMLKYIDGLK